MALQNTGCETGRETGREAQQAPPETGAQAASQGTSWRSPSFWLGCLGGVLLLAMMGLTVCDVIGRYLFNAPVRGASELTEILLCATIFLGLGAVALGEDHVTVDLFTDKIPARFHPALQALTGVFSAVVLAVVAWRIWIYAAQIGGYGGSTMSLGLPLAPLGYFCAVATAFGGGITALLPLKRLFEHLTK